MTEPFASDRLNATLPKLSENELNRVRAGGCPKCQKGALFVGTNIATGCNARCPICKVELFVSIERTEIVAGVVLDHDKMAYSESLKLVPLTWREQEKPVKRKA